MSRYPKTNPTASRAHRAGPAQSFTMPRTISRSFTPSAGRLLQVCLALLVYAFTRLHHLSALPLFVDESFHIETAQRALEGQVLASAAHGRFFRVWFNAFVGVDAQVAGWTTRAGTVVVGLLGAAAFYGLVRAFTASHRAAMVGLALWIAAPYLLFYDRMALADPLLIAFSTAAVWLAWRLMRTGSAWIAGALGGMLALVLLAKAPGVVWLPLPVVALILARGLTPRRRITLGAIVVAVFCAVWGPLELLLWIKGYNYFGLADTFTGGVDQSLLKRTRTNLDVVLAIDAAYLGWPVIVGSLAGGLYWLARKPRPALLALLALGMSGGGAILFGYNINSRYAMNQVPWVLLPLAVGLGLVIVRWPRAQWLVYAGVAAWIAVVAGPFLRDAWNDPPALPLYGNDPNEYIEHEAAGYGATEIGAWLSTTDDPLPAIGLVGNCQTLRLAAASRVVECPAVYWDGTNFDALMQMVEARAAEGPLYVAADDLSYIDPSQLPEPKSIVLAVERPGGLSEMALYRIEQGATLGNGE
ncbi:ArnT family glycosyltransferase [Aggregatilinea lenta]|uniref:ArnT family glycosyltransferase n=1 Tax=Aggregatilinea lenta TaxID=913108 RepID=UPI000E5C445B|nr:phospholipid carrier-dependent glycosyltransferase [Aggregatilinea lenta]